MSKRKVRIVTILTLVLMFVLTLSFAFGALNIKRREAYAASYTPSAIFSAGTGGEVGSNRPETATEEDPGQYFVQFTFQPTARPYVGSVYYRRDLAIKWYEAAEESADEQATDEEAPARANPGTAKYFSMTFAFPALNFTTFEIAFESAEENVSKDGISRNALVFYNENGILFAAVKDSSFDEETDTVTDADKINLGYTAGTDLTLSFAETETLGEFALTLKVGETEKELDPFTNIGGYFMEYRSSAASTPQTPMTFKAELPEPASGSEAATQTVLMKELNGQTLQVKNDDGRVEDNAKPVLVLDERVYSFRLGQRYSLTHEAIDVCDDSVNATRSYYMLKSEEDDEGNITYKKPNEFNSSDYKTLTTSTFFMPTSDSGDEEAFVSIRFKLDDGTFTDYYVYLTWYAADEAIAVKGNVADAYYLCSKCGKHHTYTEEEYEALPDDWECDGTVKGSGSTEDTACTGKKDDLKFQSSDYFDYIKVDLKAEGPHFVGLTAVDTDEAGNEVKDNVLDETAKDEKGNYILADRYQQAVEDVALDVSAGDGAYFYLPSLRDLISSDYADYRNLRFNVYYYKPGASEGSSATSATSLRYNNLRFEVDEIGEYRFRVIAQDAAGNAMKYFYDGELVSVTASNVWQIEGIPEFSFYVDYDGPSIEDTKEQTEGNRDRSYSVSSFEIIAIDGYETDYSLYYFDETKLPEGKTAPSYSDLVSAVNDAKGDLENYEGENFSGYGKGWIAKCIGDPIREYNPEITEDDEEWDRTDNAYAWDPDSSLSFTPQVSGTYLVKVTVTDRYLVNATATAYQVIYVRNPTDTIPGDSPWLQNNILAIVFFSIATVLFVAIVVLFIVKPADKTVEEVDLETLKGGKKKKKKE